MKDDLITTSQAAEILSVKPATIRAYAANRDGFPTPTRHGRHLYWRRTDITAYRDAPPRKTGRPRKNATCPDYATHSPTPCPTCGRRSTATPRHQLAGQWATARQRQNVAHLMTEDRAICGALVPGPIPAPPDTPHCTICQNGA